MIDNDPISSDIAFTASVKRAQELRGSRSALRRMRFATLITAPLMEFVEERDSCYLGTASLSGQPYIQHRGGPKGFIHKLNDSELAFADFVGNRQYISVGNLAENPQAILFLIDYENRHRVKIWGEARVVDDDPALLQQLTPDSYSRRPQQVIVFRVKAWDSNCPKHIPRKIDAVAVQARIDVLQQRIEALTRQNFDLEVEIARLRRESSSSE